MRDDVVAALLLDGVNRLLQLRVGERLGLSAPAAHEVVVMRLARRLVPHDAVADVDPLHETLRLQALERAVDARQADLAAEGVIDLLCAEAAVLALEVLEDEEPRATRPIAGTTQLSGRLFCPTHSTDDNENRYRLRRENRSRHRRARGPAPRGVRPDAGSRRRGLLSACLRCPADRRAGAARPEPDAARRGAARHRAHAARSGGHPAGEGRAL